MKKSYLVFLSLICCAQIVSAPFPALAYVYTNHMGATSVDTDTSVLGEDQDQDTSASQKSGAADGSMTAMPVTPVQHSSLQKKLSRPFFTATSLATDEEPAAQTSVPVQQSHTPAPIYTAPVKPHKAPVISENVKPVEIKQAPQKPVVAEAVAVQPTAPLPVATKPVTLTKPAEAPAKPVEAQTKPIEAPAAKAVPAPLTVVEVKPVVAKPAVTDDKTEVASLTSDEKKPFTPKEDTAKAVDTAQAAAFAPTKEKAADTKPAVPSLSDLTINFDAASSTLSPDAQKRLDDLATQLKDSVDMHLQIRGYAKGGDDGQSSARRMALSRALIVRSYLTDKGIKPIRLDVRALGSETDKTPIDRVDLVFVR